jgi:iron complex transport system permease protein
VSPTAPAPSELDPDADSGAPPPAIPDGSRRTGLLDRNWSRGAGLAVGVLALVAVVAASVAFGAKPLSLSTVWEALVSPSSSDDHTVVRSLRIPRTILGLGVGTALGLAGALMQGLTRNPLADPGILGISAGSALAVVVGISTFGVTAPTGFVWFSFLGAAVASAAVYGLGAIGRGGVTPVKLALAGAAMSYLLASLTSGVLLADSAALDVFRFWAVGSVAGREGDVVAAVTPFIVVGTAVALCLGRPLNALALGDDVARSLGQRVHVQRAIVALTVVILCGAATAGAGPILFVGLVVPHAARAICGPDYRWILAWSAVLGPVLLLGADVLGRVIARPGEIQVGVMTAVIGAPFFIVLVRRKKLAAL